MNNAGPTSQKIAMRLERDKSSSERLAQFAAASIVKNFEPKDDDELNDRLCAGEFSKVVFFDLNGLLQMLWRGHADLPKWTAHRVEIEFCNPPTGDWRQLTGLVHASLEQWREIQRRRQTIAACILSAIILAGMATLFALLGPAK